MKAIEVIGLEKRYGKSTAVDRISFDVEAGEAVGLLGPNGSGKTTLLRMLATLLKPSAGYARVMGHDGRFQSPQIRRVLGFLPDNPALEEDLTVQEYLEFFASLSGQGGAEKAGRVKGLIELLDLGPLRDRLCGALSRGMQQRVGLARTLVHDPQVLLLDEPAANLDPGSRVEMLAVLRELRRMGKTIVISSHILPELEDLCTRIVVLHKGQLRFSGPLSEGASRIKAQRRIFIRVAGTSTTLEEALRAEAGVGQVVAKDGGLELTLKEYLPDIGFVARRAVELGLSVTELREELPGLEEIFMQLTREGPGP